MFSAATAKAAMKSVGAGGAAVAMLIILSSCKPYGAPEQSELDANFQADLNEAVALEEPTVTTITLTEQMWSLAPNDRATIVISQARKYPAAQIDPNVWGSLSPRAQFAVIMAQQGETAEEQYLRESLRDARPGGLR